MTTTGFPGNSATPPSASTRGSGTSTVSTADTPSSKTTCGNTAAGHGRCSCRCLIRLGRPGATSAGIWWSLAEWSGRPTVSSSEGPGKFQPGYHILRRLTGCGPEEEPQRMGCCGGTVEPGASPSGVLSGAMAPPWLNLRASFGKLWAGAAMHSLQSPFRHSLRRTRYTKVPRKQATSSS